MNNSAVGVDLYINAQWTHCAVGNASSQTATVSVTLAQNRTSSLPLSDLIAMWFAEVPPIITSFVAVFVRYAHPENVISFVNDIDGSSMFWVVPLKSNAQPCSLITQLLAVIFCGVPWLCLPETSRSVSPVTPNVGCHNPTNPSHNPGLAASAWDAA